MIKIISLINKISLMIKKISKRNTNKENFFKNKNRKKL